MMVFVRIDAPAGLSCAFLDTVTDTFLENGFGCHTFDHPDEIANMPNADRLLALVPPGFWNQRSTYWPEEHVR